MAFTAKTVDLSDVHQLLAEGGWGQSYGVHRDRPYIRLSIHPSRHMEHAQGFVRATSSSVWFPMTRSRMGPECFARTPLHCTLPIQGGPGENCVK